MKLKLEDINKSLHTFTYDELAQLDSNIINEMRLKSGNKRAIQCFWSVLNQFKKYTLNGAKEELLQFISRNYTEQEFSKFRGVGKQVMRVAKHEFQKYGINF